MTSPNQDPGPQNPQFELSPHHFEYLNNFSAGLREAGHYAASDAQLSRHMTESQIDGAMGNAVSSTGAEGYKLVVAAESLGATQINPKAQGIFEVISHSPLLDDEGKQMLRGMSETVWGARMQAVPEDEIATHVGHNIWNQLLQITQSETPGEAKPVLKMAVLAFAAGATATHPEFQLHEQLMTEAQRFVA